TQIGHRRIAVARPQVGDRLIEIPPAQELAISRRCVVERRRPALLADHRDTAAAGQEATREEEAHDRGPRAITAVATLRTADRHGRTSIAMDGVCANARGLDSQSSRSHMAGSCAAGAGTRGRARTPTRTESSKVTVASAR